MSAVKSTIKYLIRIFPIAAVLIPTSVFAATDSVFGQWANEMLGALGVLVGRTIAFIAYLIGMLASTMLTFGGALLEWAIRLNSTVLASPTVKTGFQITLNIANLGFVLAIIIIAFITILRWEKYETKQLIKNLVIAALLINFSLTIAGIFIDFTGVLSNFFIQKASGEGISKFSDNLANAFGVQKFTNMAETGEIANSLQNVKEFGSSLVSMVASLAFVSLFTALGAIAMLGTAFMILIRYLYLTILLILMPIAWLAFAFPNLAHLWSRWWDAFLKWTFFMPATTFFLYLAVLLVSNQAKEAASPLSAAVQLGATLPAAQALQGQIWTENPFAVFSQMIAVLGLLVGGLFAAQELGISGAAGFMGAAKSVENWTKGALKRGAMTPVRPIARGGAAALTSRYLRWIPGSTDLAGVLSTAGSRKAEVAHYKKKFDSLEGMALDNALSAPLSGNSMENTAALQKAVETKKLPSFLEGRTEKELLKLASHAKANDPKLVKEIIDNDPELAGLLSGETDAGKIDKAIIDAMTAISASKASDVTTKSLRNKVVASAATENFMSGLARSGSEEKLKALSEGLEEAAGLITPARQQMRAGLKVVEEQAVNLRKKIKEDEETAGTPAAKAAVNILKTNLATLRQNIKNALQQMQLSPEEIKAYDKLQTLRRIGNP